MVSDNEPGEIRDRLEVPVKRLPDGAASDVSGMELHMVEQSIFCWFLCFPSDGVEGFVVEAGASFHEERLDDVACVASCH